jgi:hypothetical protein
VAALLLCQVARVQLSVVNGKPVVREGQLATLELPPLIQRHNGLAARLLA